MGNETVVIKKHFPKADFERQYTTLPFEVPENVDSMTVTYKYDKTKTRREDGFVDCNEIDIALLDKEGKQAGASGACRESFFVSSRCATTGYQRAELSAGTYQIVLGFFFIKADGVDVEVTIEFKPKVADWYKGDCHSHTFYSDGRYSPDVLIKKALKCNLDYLIITDHNHCCKDTPIVFREDLNIICGEELTCFAGHINMWGSTEPITQPYYFTTTEQLKPLLDEAISNGAILSLNHPHCPKCGYHLPMDEEHLPISCVEIWNGPMTAGNMKAERWWREQLLAGRKLFAVGGSDYHQSYVVTMFLAVPTTYAYAKSNGSADILDALANGHSFITRNPKSSKMFLTSGSAIVGDSVEFTDSSYVELSVTKLKRGHRLIVYNNDKIIYDFVAKQTCNHSVRLDVPEKGFVLAEILYRESCIVEAIHHKVMKTVLPNEPITPLPELLWAATNPIFFE